ncbi:MAG TPA: NACHT domain-containing protein [Candidatus Sulfotelmatobacter sp.]
MLPVSPSEVTAWLPAVLQNLVASSLYSLLGQVLRLGRSRYPGEGTEEKIRKRLAAVALEAIVGSGPLADGSADELRSFLSSPEAQTVVRQIYSYRLTEGKNGGVDGIRTEFSRLLQGRVQGADDKLSRSLFKVILDVCDDALGAAVEKGSMAALDAKQTFMHRMLLDELAAINSNVELLSHKPDIAGILEFERRYREQVSSRHDSIQPPHLDRHKKYPIDSLYVVPRLTPYHSKEPAWALRHTDLVHIIKKEQLLSTVRRAVLLGNPGAGKSTFAQKVCHDLATGLVGDRQVSPILVVLRDYGAQKKEHNCSILQFIETRAAAWYQVSPPTHAFQYLLLNGRAMVIFDGLDELLETSYRREIGDDIELFCNLYPSTSVVVTSRVVGYEQAPLDARRFRTYRLVDFDDAQVQEYALKWFSTDETTPTEKQSKKARAFLSESRSVPDLRSNPLMLALMCNIYLGEDFIPSNRPEVYKKCALMLFDRWDRSRRIDTAYGFENQLSPIMTHIAHWLYANPILQSGVTQEQLVKECAKYLHKRRYESVDRTDKVIMLRQSNVSSRHNNMLSPFMVERVVVASEPYAPRGHHR